METKTHYRKVFKSEHLGSADLEEMLEEKKKLVFTIKHVVQYNLVPNDRKSGVSVAGKRIGANIAFFTDKTKPLVLNATNSKIMAKLTGSKFVEEWRDVTIELYINSNVRFGNDTVSGVRIKDKFPVLEKHELTPDSRFWAKAQERALAKEATFESLNENYTITQANFDLMTWEA
jgi:hypothetical protein